MKKCPMCGVEKLLSAFYTNNGKPRYCKPCWIQKTRSHPKFKEWQRTSRLRRRHGMTPAEWDAALVAQEGCCAICRTSEPGAKGWHADHDHQTGTFRGLLCVRCNNMLGLAKDSATTLALAAAYVRDGGY